MSAHKSKKFEAFKKFGVQVLKSPQVPWPYIEREMERRGVKWYNLYVPQSLIVSAPNNNLQPRFDATPNQENVTGIRAALENKDRPVPDCLVWVVWDKNFKPIFHIVGGVHRIQAREQKGYTTHPVYAFETENEETVEVLAFRSNLEHGDKPNYSEAKARGLRWHKVFGWSVTKAALEAGLTVDMLDRHIRLTERVEDLEKAGVKIAQGKTNIILATSKEKSLPIATRIYNLATNAGLKGPEVSSITSKTAKAKSEAEKHAIVQDEEDLLGVTSTIILPKNLRMKRTKSLPGPRWVKTTREMVSGIRRLSELGLSSKDAKDDFRKLVQDLGRLK